MILLLLALNAFVSIDIWLLCQVCKFTLIDSDVTQHLVITVFQEDVNITCSNGVIRLADGLTEHEGRVEICYDNHWGAVCGNSWDASEANVVCRQLGKIPIGE